MSPKNDWFVCRSFRSSAKAQNTWNTAMSYCPPLTDEAVRAVSFHCHTLTSVTIAGCPKGCIRNGVIVLGLLLQRIT